MVSAPSFKLEGRHVLTATGLPRFSAPPDDVSICHGGNGRLCPHQSNYARTQRKRELPRAANAPKTPAATRAASLPPPTNLVATLRHAQARSNAAVQSP